MGTDACEILFFVKLPLAGKVKTRLARDLGAGRAAKLYEAFAEDQLATLTSTGIPVRVCCVPMGTLADYEMWLGNQYSFEWQLGFDLGARMLAAFDGAFRRGRKRVVLTGSDAPMMQRETVLEAFDALQHRDAVFSPSPDGGYSLAGYRASGLVRDVFLEMPWSTSGVFEETCRRLNEHDASYAVLQETPDVDTLQELGRLVQSAVFGNSPMTSRDNAPRSFSLLEHWGF
ncbi:hypothetical protein SAMN02745702_02861 [Desulfobaculum bizertense DSM 18034]|uniref:Glycosyltransferase n=2 Tax=Desulfobaculum TaxID=1433996 RepID=A0A1T4X0N1_9BACT|nr:hypothetical protein SAMN02745702_02861 [Desulfobaculum bizertense DSM 18034]